RELANNVFRCIEKFVDGNLIIEVIDPNTDWAEWIKTLGVLHESKNGYSILYNGNTFGFELKPSRTGYVVMIPEKVLKENPAFGKMFRQVFRKAAYCTACRVCETNCKKRSITFT